MVTALSSLMCAGQDDEAGLGFVPQQSQVEIQTASWFPFSALRSAHEPLVLYTMECAYVGSAELFRLQPSLRFT